MTSLRIVMSIFFIIMLAGGLIVGMADRSGGHRFDPVTVVLVSLTAIGSLFGLIGICVNAYRERWSPDDLKEWEQTLSKGKTSFVVRSFIFNATIILGMVLFVGILALTGEGSTGSWEEIKALVAFLLIGLLISGLMPFALWRQYKKDYNRKVPDVSQGPKIVP